MRLQRRVVFVGKLALHTLHLDEGGCNLIVCYIGCVGTQTFHFVGDNVRFVSQRKGGVRVRASWQACGRSFGMVVSII